MASRVPGDRRHRHIRWCEAGARDHRSALETPGGVVVVDHKSYPGGADRWKDKAREFAPQLGAYAHVLAAGGKSVIAMYVHFTIGGGVARLGR